MAIRPLGLLIVFVCNLIPVYWFWQLAKEWPGDELAVLSLYFGVAALVTMGLIFLLATRAQWLEFIFGGLDRIYVLHKWMGIAALALVMLHDSIDSEIDGATVGWLSELAETLGENSLTMLQVLLAITLIMLVPYHWWRWTHKLMGVLYILAVGHFIWIDKPFFDSSPLAIYTYAFCLLGVIAYCYTVLPLSWLRRLKSYHDYRVASIEQTGDAIALTLHTDGKPLRHRAGQFAFIKFDIPGLRETHPFTISQAPKSDGELRFTIKNLGDFTQNLQQQLQPNTAVRVQGAFGHFYEKKNQPKKIWVAAGIGITPFLARAQQLESTNQPVDLFYCVRSEGDAVHLKELKHLANTKEALNLHVINSTQRERLTANDIVQVAAENWPRVQVSFCGPKVMRETLQTGLLNNHLKHRFFVYEEFEIRSSIGLDKLLYWFLPKIKKAIGFKT